MFAPAFGRLWPQDRANAEQVRLHLVQFGLGINQACAVTAEVAPARV